MPSPRQRRDGDGAGVALGQTGGLRTDVALVEGQQLRNRAGPDLVEHRSHRLDLAFGIGADAVDDMDQEIRFGDDLQGGPERLDQLVRQLAHESHRVRQQHRLAAGQRQAPGSGIEGREQPILDQDAGVGQLVEQRGLARVGVADQGDGGQPAPTPGLALQPPLLGEPAQVAFQPGHAPDQPAAIDLQLGFPGAPGADATGLLGQAPGPGPAGGAAGSAAGPAPPGPCLPGWRRSGRRCRGSPRCGRWRCGPGSFPGSGTGPGSARRRRPPCRRPPPSKGPAALRLCPARRRWPDRAGPAAAAPGRPRRLPPCRPARPARPGGAPSPPPARAGRVTPTRTIFSRKLRSIRLIEAPGRRRRGHAGTAERHRSVGTQTRRPPARRAGGR